VTPHREVAAMVINLLNLDLQIDCCSRAAALRTPMRFLTFLPDVEMKTNISDKAGYLM
jgi:hypothetical protein